MPWKTRNRMNLRQEFVELATREGANRRELCRRFGISPKTGYALLARYAAEGSAAFEERSRRPLNSPTQTDPILEAAVLALRREHRVGRAQDQPAPVGCWLPKGSCT